MLVADSMHIAHKRAKRNRINKNCELRRKKYCMFTVAVRISLLGKPISPVGKNISSLQLTLFSLSLPSHAFF
jgi:hypothetical protein